MSTRRLGIGLVTLCLLVGLTAVSASAQQYTLGASSQNVTLTGTGTGLNLTMGTSGGSCPAGDICLSGSGIDAAGEAGTWTLVTSGGPPNFGPNNGQGVFALANLNGVSTTFSWTDPDGDSSVSNIAVTYVDVANGSSNPHVDFTTTLSSAIDEIILGTIGCTGLSAGTTCNIDNVALVNGAKASGTVSAGQVHTPEPASMALFGTGLLLLGAAVRRRRRQT